MNLKNVCQYPNTPQCKRCQGTNKTNKLIITHDCSKQLPNEGATPFNLIISLLTKHAPLCGNFFMIQFLYCANYRYFLSYIQIFTIKISDNGTVTWIPCILLCYPWTTIWRTKYKNLLRVSMTSIWSKSFPNFHFMV